MSMESVKRISSSKRSHRREKEPVLVRIFHSLLYPIETVRIQGIVRISRSHTRLIGRRSVFHDIKIHINTERDSSSLASTIGLLIFRIILNRSSVRIPIWVDFSHFFITHTRLCISVPIRSNSPIPWFIAFSTKDTQSSSSRLIFHRDTNVTSFSNEYVRAILSPEFTIRASEILAFPLLVSEIV